MKIENFNRAKEIEKRMEELKNVKKQFDSQGIRKEFSITVGGTEGIGYVRCNFSSDTIDSKWMQDDSLKEALFEHIHSVLLGYIGKEIQILEAEFDNL